MDSENSIFNLILNNKSEDNKEIIINDNSYDILSVTDIYKLYHAKLCHDRGLSAEKFNYNNKQERSTRTIINKKSLAAKKYLSYLSETGAPINIGTMTLYKKLIKQRYDQGKVKYSTFRNYTNTGLKQFVDWCKENKYNYVKKDAKVQKFKIISEDIILKFSDWVKVHKKVSYETSTSYQHVIRLNKYFLFLHENNLNKALSMPLINKFIENQDIITATINNYRSTFRLFADFLLENIPKAAKRTEDFEKTKQELYTVKKLKKLTTDKESKIKITLSKEQREYLFKGCKTARQRVMIALAAYSGLRCISITRLTWDDVNFQSKTIRIWNKGHDGKKERPIPMIVYNSLLELKNELKEVKADDYVLLSRKGGDYKGKSMNACIQSLLITVGLREVQKFGRTWTISAHNLRHTFATRLLEDTGGDLVTVSHMLCHSDTKITMEYLKCLKQEKADSLYVEEYRNVFDGEYEITS